MVEISYKKQIELSEEKQIEVCYQLISEADGTYSVECYVVDSTDQEKDYSILHNVIVDHNLGEHFVQLLAKEDVLPVHLQDIWDDYNT